MRTNGFVFNVFVDNSIRRNGKHMVSRRRWNRWRLCYGRVEQSFLYGSASNFFSSRCADDYSVYNLQIRKELKGLQILKYSLSTFASRLVFKMFIFLYYITSNSLNLVLIRFDV